MRRKRPLTEIERRRLERRRERAAWLVPSLPDDRDAWQRGVTTNFGLEAGKFAAALFPDRDELRWMLGSELMALTFDILEAEGVA